MMSRAKTKYTEGEKLKTNESRVDSRAETYNKVKSIKSHVEINETVSGPADEINSIKGPAVMKLVTLKITQ